MMLKGREVSEQINILGDDGVPVEYHRLFWKSELIDFILYQQDAFDNIDTLTPLERQKGIMEQLNEILDMEFGFEETLTIIGLL